MPYSFGARSESLLGSVHPELQRLAREAIRTSPMDFTVTEGARNAATQADKFTKGLSRVRFSKHQLVPAQAVHFDPYPVLYPQDSDPPMIKTKKYARYYMLSMHIRATAIRLVIPVRWGGAWDNSYDILNNDFDDLAHYELEVSK